MADSARSGTSTAALSRVPEVTVWFWVIKVLCTTVGESFADWINMTLGVGLIRTAMIFTVILAFVLAWQLSVRRYVPFVYWLTVVVVSVTGTLYTDILTDTMGIPLAASTIAFAALLAVVFGVWFARERTLSIHSIVSLPRELFYWLAVLVTFALGTAVGDWTLQLTGWGPGRSVLLPAGLIVAIVIGWRFGANAVLSFWLAYILTRPLGANLGDWLAAPKAEQGLGLGVAATSLIFLGAILATVVYLSVTRSDVIERDAAPKPAPDADPARERVMLGYLGVVVVGTAALLVWAAGRPHEAPASAETESESAAAVSIPVGQSATAQFPPATVTKYRGIVQDTLVKLNAGDQAGATTRIKDLETAWDDDQTTLQPMDNTGWAALDGQIDQVLSALRAPTPDPATESQTLTQLLASLR